MSNPEINDLWNDALRRDADEFVGMRVLIAVRQEVLRRKDEALGVAEGIIARSPEATDAETSVTSGYIPFGTLDTPDTTGRSHCFAEVWINRQTKVELSKTRSGLFAPPELVAKPTNATQDFGVRIYAGRADTTDLLCFETTLWSVRERYEDTSEIAILEARLAMVDTALGPQQAA